MQQMYEDVHLSLGFVELLYKLVKGQWEQDQVNVDWFLPV